MTGYHSRHRESAQEAAAWTGTRCFPTAEALVTASDAIFFTVPDGAIPTVYQGLGTLTLTGKQLCHCSGARTAREGFPGPGHPGASYYSIHPLFPVSGKYSAWRELSGAFFLPGGKALTCLGGRRRSPPWARRSAASPAGRRRPTTRPAPWPATWSAPWWGECDPPGPARLFSGGGVGGPGPRSWRRTFAIYAQRGLWRPLTGPVERGDRGYHRPPPGLPAGRAGPGAVPGCFGGPGGPGPKKAP